MPSADTIVAIATAQGRAGVGVIRVSGPGTRQLAQTISGRILRERYAELTEFRGAHGQVIDRGIGILFLAPRSYTGEDVLEIQAHGGVAVLRMLLRRCIELGARIAEPGEFTRRAFLNDKLDLAQAESVADLIDASSEDAVFSAQRSLAGEFSRHVSIVREELISLRTLVEAILDFPEDDIDLIESHQIDRKLESCKDRISALLASGQQGSLLREGVQVVLMGAPNVGKSSLMNRLAEEEVAIVTEVAGTTRDVLRHTLVVDGMPIHILDTAGLRHSNDPVEKIGIERTIQQISQADLIVAVTTADEAETDIENVFGLAQDTRKIRVINKIDLTGQKPGICTEGTESTVWLSAKTGDGIEGLRQAVAIACGRRSSDEVPFMARERHLSALTRARRHVETAVFELTRIELCAEELRLAQQALGEITGEFSADDLLGEIFSRFCIGK